MTFEEIVWDDMTWIHLAEDVGIWRAVVNAIMNIRVTYNAVNYLTKGLLASQGLLHGVI